MSAAPRFRLVLLVENREIRLFGLSGKTWSPWDKTISLTEPVPQDLLEQFAGEPALILVSDSHNGHLQLNQPNKKKNLEPAALTQLLEEEYDIDTAAYLMGWRTFPVSRDQVQISVSGVEREVVDAVTEWITPLQPKKLWAMPFAWFVSVLKSVDPAFIAVENDGSLLLSHHYLGVDDARALKLGEVEKYIAARQKERKETHLLYLQASEKTADSLSKKLAKSDVTIQSLLPDAKQESLLAVVTAVLERAQTKLADLLYFEVDVPEMDLPAVAAAAPAVAEAGDPDEAVTEEAETSAAMEADELDEEATEALEEDLESADVADGAGSLQPPVPPGLQPPVPPAAAVAAAPRSATAVEVVEDEPSEADEGDETELDTSEKAETLSEQKNSPFVKAPQEEVANLRPVKEVPAEVAAGAAAIVADRNSAAEEDESEELSEPVQPQEDVFSKLKGSGVQSSNVERYAPVEAKRSMKGPIIVFFVVVVITALIGGGIFWSQQGGELLGALPQTPASPTPSPVASSTPEPSPVATASATPTPAASEVDKEELTVLVVNATGINGLAGRVSEQLGTSGWENVQAGNATGTYEDGATYVTADLDPAVVAALEEDLDRELTPAAIRETRASQFDIVIVLAEQ